MTSTDWEWFRHLAVSLWLRVDNPSAAFALADEWAGRVEEEVMDGVVRRTPPSMWQPLPGMEGSDITPSPLPAVTRLLHTIDSRGSVRGRVLMRGHSIAVEASRTKNPIAGSVTWMLAQDRQVRLHSSVEDLPSDPDQPVHGHELHLSCSLTGLAQAERDELARIGQEIAERAELVYGQVGFDDGQPALLGQHPARLGRYQAWQMRRLRGYDWVTMIPRHLAVRIDEDHLDYGRTHLHQVVTWDSGGLRLQATPAPETYTRRRPVTCSVPSLRSFRMGHRSHPPECRSSPKYHPESWSTKTRPPTAEPNARHPHSRITPPR